MNIDEVVARVKAFAAIFEQHGYSRHSCGEGIKAWSHRHTGATGHIDLRGSDWAAYDLNDVKLGEGVTPEDLQAFLSNR